MLEKQTSVAEANVPSRRYRLTLCGLLFTFFGSVSALSAAVESATSATNTPAPAGPAATAAATNDYADAWGPVVGTELPILLAADQSGQRRELANLTGENGLLLFLVRSADW